MIISIKTYKHTMKVYNYSKVIHKERTDKTMAELSHLDQLEAEAIYIIREVAAVLIGNAC